MNFIGGCQGVSKHFLVKLPGSTTALHSNLSGSSLSDNGLSHSSTVRVIMINNEDLESEQVICIDYILCFPNVFLIAPHNFSVFFCLFFINLTRCDEIIFKRV